MRIDPAKVTIDDLEKYESMMKGQGALGVSNSKRERVSAIKHTWQAFDTVEEFGPMKIKLD